MSENDNGVCTGLIEGGFSENWYIRSSKESKADKSAVELFASQGREMVGVQILRTDR